MSIRVHGTIGIVRKHGSRGDFNIGDLSTEIGEFEVKDTLIEEFEPGKYSGEFVIRWIEPDSFAWRGRVFVKNRAQLEAIFVDEAAEGAPPPAAPPERDPIDERPARAPVADAPATTAPAIEATAPAADTGAPADRTTADPDLALFGAEVYAQLTYGSLLKLDPTVDRQQFRAQRDRLKALGYGFDARSQAWSLRTAERPAELAAEQAPA